MPEEWKCKRCARCCTNLLPLTRSEVLRLRKIAKKEHKLFYKKDWYDICPFLNHKKECDIYDERPHICREFTCNDYEHGVFSPKMDEVISKEEIELVNVREIVFKYKEKGNE